MVVVQRVGATALVEVGVGVVAVAAVDADGGASCFRGRSRVNLDGRTLSDDEGHTCTFHHYRLHGTATAADTGPPAGCGIGYSARFDGYDGAGA